MTVGYEDGSRPNTEKWAIPLAVIGSLLLALLVMAILVGDKDHRQLFYKMMPAKAIKRLRKGKQVVERYDTVTIFFSDIVGFTSIWPARCPQRTSCRCSTSCTCTMNWTNWSRNTRCLQSRNYRVSLLDRWYVIVSFASIPTAPYTNCISHHLCQIYSAHNHTFSPTTPQRRLHVHGSRRCSATMHGPRGY